MQIIRKPFDYAIFCREMSRRMPCQHGSAVPRRKGLKLNGSPWFRYQCRDCGAPLQPTQLKHEIVKAYEAEHGPVEPWDKDAEDAFHSESIRHSAEIRRSHAWDFDGWWHRYTLYLASPEWRLCRTRALERDRYTCRRCGVRPAKQVHHLTYERAGNEQLDDLISVCVACHGFIHNG